LFSQNSTHLTPQAREQMTAELVEPLLDGIEARYLRAAP
jgi:hypothetical protein